MIGSMSLINRAKEIVGLAKTGKVDEALTAYAALFASPDFSSNPIEQRRQVIKLLVNAKVPPNMPAKNVVEAHRAAIAPLEAMIGEAGDPHDFELLGICCVYIGDEKRAAEAFRAGLTLAREQNSKSDLCGSLMKWVAAV
jgi:hypothetical protein